MGRYEKVSSSFRDPSGFLFYDNGILYRQINQSYKDDYVHLMDSGLYNNLVESKLLVPHVEVDIKLFVKEKGYKVIQPEMIRDPRR